nr:uncharacterized protein LOC111423379 [Onthophagus taurus]
MSRGYRYALTCVDRFSRWPEVIPVENIEASTIAKAFVTGWVSRFGTPLRITTDQGRQFQSQLFMELNATLGTKHFRTTACHPAANGLVERFHRQLKGAIRCQATEKWVDILPVVLLGIRSAWRDDLSATTAELVYGELLRLPGEFLAPRESRRNEEGATNFTQELKKHFQQLQPVHGTRHGSKKIFVFRDLATCTHVWIRLGGEHHSSLEVPYEGPYPVTNRNDRTFTLEKKGKQITVSIDRLKPAYILSGEEQRQEDPQRPEATRNNSGPQQTDLAPPTTRYGRRVRFPDHFQAGL